MIKSISYDQTEIIHNILELHAPDHKIDCDPTFSKGNFYKNTGIDIPKYRFDILPQCEDVEYGDSRNLPLPPDSVQCIMFDPPFLATTGKSLSSDENNNAINKRFGVYSSEKELHRFYIDSIKEAHRILKSNGILIFKCQDKISSSMQYMSHVFVMNEAVKAGFYPKDLFVLMAENRIMADWQAKAQKNARKYHCYFWVFEKCNKHTIYV